MYANLINSYSKTLDVSGFRLKNSFPSKKRDNSFLRSNDLISISREAYLPEKFKNDTKFAIKQDINELKSLKEDITQKDIRYFYQKKAKWLDERIKKISERNILLTDEQFVISTSGKRLNFSGQKDVKEEAKRVVLKNPVLKKEMQSLNRLGKFLRTDDLSKLYYKEFSKSPSKQVFEKYKNAFNEILDEKYNISYNKKNLKSFISKANGEIVKNWDAKQGFISSLY